MATLDAPRPYPSLISPLTRGRARRPAWWWHGWLLPLSALLGVLAWELLVQVKDYPDFILPTPARVWATFIETLLNGKLLWHTQITLVEIAGGLSLGAVAAFALGYFIAQSPFLEKLLTPYIVTSQAIPVVAVAPLLVIWFGVGLASKVVIGALIVFFPILVNTIAGLRQVEPDLRDLMRSLQASRRQMFFKLELPAALPAILSGLKIGATLAVIGAVVGEFVGADRGLGFWVNFARGQYNTPLMLVAVGALVVIALALYGSVAWLEKTLLNWKGS
jgi:NitT/TauT family transport system permease protein